MLVNIFIYINIINIYIYKIIRVVDNSDTSNNANALPLRKNIETISIYIPEGENIIRSIQVICKIK